MLLALSASLPLAGCNAGDDAAGSSDSPLAAGNGAPPAAMSAGTAGSRVMDVPGAAGSAGAAGASVTAGGAGAQGAAGASGAAGSTAGAPSAGATAPGEPCRDDCPFAAGVEWACRLRFMYGVNYAWHQFGSDFGGNTAWNQRGVSGDPTVETELADMASQRVNVIRWWLWPDFRGDGVALDADDSPTGLGGTAIADLERALELADEYDLYLMLTLFSFDNFRPTRDESGLRIAGITPIVLDPVKRQRLIEQVVKPFARAAAESPFAERVIAWDVINEPEWAISGASLYGGDPVFDPMTELATVSHAQMETFVKEVIVGLREASDAMITVGATAIKWRHAWSQVDVDFHQFHIYDWVNQYWPYSESPAFYGVDDKPVVMGEFPWAGLSGASYSTVVTSWFDGGYGGALSWAYTDGARGNLAEVASFAEPRSCQTRY